MTPALHRQAIAADGTAALRVTIEGEAGGERELWSRVLRARDAAPGEVKVGLPGKAGDVIRLALYTGGERHAWSVWKAPRVLGDAAAPAQRAYPPADAAKERSPGCDGDTARADVRHFVCGFSATASV